MPAVGKDRDVMVPVKEDEWLLVDDNEKSIEEFREFGEDEELHPETGGPRSECDPGIRAKIIPQAHGCEVVNELRSGTNCSDPGKEGEGEVPQSEIFSPLPRFFRSHSLLAEDDESGVGNKCQYGYHGIILHVIQNRHGIIVLLPSAIVRKMPIGNVTKVDEVKRRCKNSMA